MKGVLHDEGPEPAVKARHAFGRQDLVDAVAHALFGKMFFLLQQRPGLARNGTNSLAISDVRCLYDTVNSSAALQWGRLEVNNCYKIGFVPFC